METQIKALPQSNLLKNYQVALYKGDVCYENRQLLHAFYANEYNSEKEAKKEAFKWFMELQGADFYDTVVLTESLGFKLSGKDKPYASEAAITRIIAKKRV